GQKCGRKRPCGHGCPVKCHPENAVCPTLPECEEIVEITCPCGRRKTTGVCRLLTQRASGGGEERGDAASATELECDEICAREKRSRLLAEAFAARAAKKATTTIGSSEQT